MKKVMCDICGKEIVGEMGNLVYVRKQIPINGGQEGLFSTTLDICIECVDELLEHINETKSNRNLREESGDTGESKKR